jgi:alkylation response protein AidB-like acyl-CoA dehydrogenase
MDDVISRKPLVDPLARVRELGPAILAAADTIEQTRRIPEPLLSQLHDARLFRMLLPLSVGGDEIDPVAYVRAVETASGCDGSVGWCLSIANSIALIAPYLDIAIARKIFEDPRATCAWGPPNECTARAAPGGYRVTGEWSFASGCRHSSWMGAHGTVVEPDGSLRLNRFGRPTLRTWLFPTAQATLLDTWDTIGLRGTASDSYRVDDLFVAEEFSSTREDPELRQEPGRLYAFPQQTMYSVGISAVALGLARGMLDAFIELAGQKTPRGMMRLADSGVVQAEVAKCAARLGAARAYLADTLAEIYESADAVAPIDIPARGRVRLAGTHAIATAVSVADYTYKAAGVDAIFPSSPFMRRFRDIHTVSQQIQSRDVHFETCGQILLGNSPAVFL